MILVVGLAELPIHQRTAIGLASCEILSLGRISLEGNKPTSKSISRPFPFIFSLYTFLTDGCSLSSFLFASHKRDCRRRHVRILNNSPAQVVINDL